jgi:hypothetical protein
MTPCGITGLERVNRPLCMEFYRCLLDIRKFRIILPYINSATWEGGDVALCILNIDTKWRWVISFTFGPLYSWRNSVRYPLDIWGLGGSQQPSV